MSGKTLVPQLIVLAGAALSMWLLALAKPTGPVAWMSFGVMLLLPYLLAAGLISGLSRVVSGRALLAVALIPALVGLVIAASPYFGKPDAQGGLTIILAPVPQLLVLGIVVFAVSRRLKG